MRSITLAAAAIAVLAAVTPAGAQTALTPFVPAHINVSGQGSVERVPDRVFVTFSIVTNDDVATRATSTNNTLYAALAAKLGGLGIDPAADEDDRLLAELQPASGPAEPAVPTALRLHRHAHRRGDQRPYRPSRRDRRCRRRSRCHQRRRRLVRVARQPRGVPRRARRRGRRRRRPSPQRWPPPRGVRIVRLVSLSAGS